MFKTKGMKESGVINESNFPESKVALVYGQKKKMYKRYNITFSKQKVKEIDLIIIIRFLTRRCNLIPDSSLQHIRVESQPKVVKLNIDKKYTEINQFRGGDLKRKCGPYGKGRSAARLKHSSKKSTVFADALPHPYPSKRANIRTKIKTKLFNSNSPFEKGGPFPFENYKYNQDLTYVADNIVFGTQNRRQKNYDKHKSVFPFLLGVNRNKESLRVFEEAIKKSVKNADMMYNGCYRFQDPAYIFLTETIVGNETVYTTSVINATNLEHITIVNLNPKDWQFQNLTSTRNIGLDTRRPNPRAELPTMLRLRGGPTHFT